MLEYHNFIYLPKAGQADQDMNLLKGCPGMEYVFNSDRAFNQLPRGIKMVGGALALPLSFSYFI